MIQSRGSPQQGRAPGRCTQSCPDKQNDHWKYAPAPLHHQYTTALHLSPITEKFLFPDFLRVVATPERTQGLGQVPGQIKVRRDIIN